LGWRTQRTLIGRASLRSAIVVAVLVSLTTARSAGGGEAKPERSIQGRLLQAPIVDIRGPFILKRSVPAKVRIDMRKLAIAGLSPVKREVPLLGAAIEDRALRAGSLAGMTGLSPARAHVNELLQPVLAPLARTSTESAPRIESLPTP
jgi:hypothetical protein